VKAQSTNLVFSLSLLAWVLPVSAQDNPSSNSPQAASTQQDIGARKARNPIRRWLRATEIPVSFGASVRHLSSQLPPALDLEVENGARGQRQAS
jgi:hypothetical protein